MQKLIILSTLALLLCSNAAFAQIKTPASSPTGKISQEIGLVKMDIEYSRPSAKGRKIFGELVPFGEMWRTGANASTKVTFSDKVKVNGTELPTGTYALYTIPGEKEWTIIFYKNTNFWGTPGKDFSENDVAAKFMVKPTTLKEAVESLTFNITNLKSSSADIELTWEMTKVVIPVMLDTDTKVMADIKSQMDGPSATTYYQSARYYLEEKKDLNVALAWIQMALDKGGEKFYIVRTKALILAELGRYKDAIAAAERSTELAKVDSNTDYPRMNDKSIAEWKKKM
jgi:tetratricopeptide (TPR) repeat protein